MCILSDGVIYSYVQFNLSLMSGSSVMAEPLVVKQHHTPRETFISCLTVVLHLFLASFSFAAMRSTALLSVCC